MMNTNLAAVAFASLLAIGSPLALAADSNAGTTADSAVPPTVLPGVNQNGGTEKRSDSADKKGEEASGSNSGADAKAIERDAATSSGEKSDRKKHPASGS